AGQPARQTSAIGKEPAWRVLPGRSDFLSIWTSSNPSCAGKQTLGISGCRPQSLIERLRRELTHSRRLLGLFWLKTLSPSHESNWTDRLINLFSLIIGYRRREAG